MFKYLLPLVLVLSACGDKDGEDSAAKDSGAQAE
jgi:hypothetical protein